MVERPKPQVPRRNSEPIHFSHNIKTPMKKLACLEIAWEN